MKHEGMTGSRSNHWFTGFDLGHDSDTVAGLFQFREIQFRYDPYPIGLVTNLFDNTTYMEMVNTWPPYNLFRHKPSLGNKYSLSEIQNPKHYYEFIRSNSIWIRVYKAIKSREFIEGTIRILKSCAVDLGLLDHLVSVNDHNVSVIRRLKEAKRTFQLYRPDFTPLRSRFEFSMLPSKNGCVRPHTDGPRKLITLVISMVRPAEWSRQCGGGTMILKSADSRQSFNQKNKYLDFKDTIELETLPFRPNQCVLFVKTFNSLHAVAPMTGTDNEPFRKTLTINIETND